MTMINKIFVTVVLLSIAGSIVGIIFLATRSLIYKYTTADYVVKINKAAILSFVIPFFSILGIIDNSNHIFSEYDSLVLVQDNSLKSMIYEIREIGNLANVISMVWFVGVILYLIIQIIIWGYFRRIIWNSREQIIDYTWCYDFQKICNEMGMTDKRIGLFAAPNINQPCAVGVFQQNILIPKYLIQKLDKDEINMVLTHELTHIHKKDVFTKITMFTLCSINWFNPLLRILRNSLYDWIEINCDEDITANMDISFKRAYVDMLIRLNEEATNEHQKPYLFSAITYLSAGKDLKHLKQRIGGIMKKEQKTARMAKAIILVGTFCTMACGTAFAKEIDFPMNSVFSNHVKVMDEAEFIIEEVEVVDYYNEYIEFDGDAFQENTNFSFVVDPSVTYEVIYADGTVGVVIEPTDSDARHLHTFKNVNVKEHTKNSDGSCVIVTYEGKQCTSCGATLVGDIISTTEYAVCTH